MQVGEHKARNSTCQIELTVYPKKKKLNSPKLNIRYSIIYHIICQGQTLMHIGANQCSMQISEAML